MVSLLMISFWLGDCRWLVRIRRIVLFYLACRLLFPFHIGSLYPESSVGFTWD